MIAFCAWFSSRDESSGISEPSVAAAPVPPPAAAKLPRFFVGGGYLPLPEAQCRTHRRLAIATSITLSLSLCPYH